jgi:hypothetical protein
VACLHGLSDIFVNGEYLAYSRDIEDSAGPAGWGGQRKGGPAGLHSAPDADQDANAGRIDEIDVVEVHHQAVMTFARDGEEAITQCTASKHVDIATHVNNRDTAFETIS